MKFWVYILACFTCLLPSTYAKSIVPEFEVIRTKNGVPIYYFTSPNIPIFQVEMIFDRGGDLDPERLSGLSMFSAAMTRKGVVGMSENQISERIDDLAAGIDFGVGEETSSLVAYGLNEHSDAILDLVFRQLKEPTFPHEPFERTKANHLDSIQQLPESPGALASYVLDLVLFNGTSKARPTSGFKADVLRMKLEDLKKFYPKMIRTDLLKVLVIGGKAKSEILGKVIAGIEGLPCSECGKKLEKPKLFTYPKWKLAKKDQVLLIKRPGVSEAHVRMGMIGVKRDVEEYYDLRVAETILSGYFGSRMNLILREKLNLTYNIDAGYDFGKNVGTFTVATSTRNEKLGELLQETEKLLKEFSEANFSDEEMKTAKDYLMGSFPLRLQNRFVIASTFFHGILNGLPTNFLDAFQSKIEQVSRESIKKALKKYFRLNEIVTVIAADPRAVEKVLKKSKIEYRLEQPQTFF